MFALCLIALCLPAEWQDTFEPFNSSFMPFLRCTSPASQRDRGTYNVAFTDLAETPAQMYEICRSCVGMQDPEKSLAALTDSYFHDDDRAIEELGRTIKNSESKVVKYKIDLAAIEVNSLALPPG